MTPAPHRFAPPWPPFDAEIADAMAKAMADGTWGQYQGPHTQRLADALATMLDIEHVLLCCSGTIAVQLALRGLGVGDGDEVLLAAYDYPGNFRAIEAVGATPVLVDVQSNDVTIDAIRLAEACGPKTCAVIASHLHGMMAPMRAIMTIAEAHGLGVVEDACQTPGATIEGRQAGTWGDVGVFSFGGSKLLSAGRGGAIVTRRADVHQREIFAHQGNDAFPLSQLQAIVLLPQLAKLAERNKLRRENVERLVASLGTSSRLRPLLAHNVDVVAAYYKLAFWCEATVGNTRDEFIERAQAVGVAIDSGFRGFTHRGSKRCRRAGSLDNSTRAASELVVLHHPVLLESAETIEQLAMMLREATR